MGGARSIVVAGRKAMQICTLRARFQALLVGLALVGFAAGCSEDRGSAQQEAREAGQVVGEEARGLGDAAEQGAAAKAARDAEATARQAAAQLAAEGAAAAAEQDADAVGDSLRKNIDETRSAAEEAYEEDREEGEGRLEAAGDAYNAVLDVPRDKEPQ
jgi:hypothetical protein